MTDWGLLEDPFIEQCIYDAARQACSRFADAEFDDCLQEARLWVVTHPKIVAQRIEEFREVNPRKMLVARIYGRLRDPLLIQAQRNALRVLMPQEVQ